MEALLERENDACTSDAERRVTRIIGRQALPPALHEEYYAGNNQTAYKGYQQEDAGHREHADYEVDADIGRRLGRFANVDDNRPVLQQSQGEHQLFRF
jgi:hypothetical protein